MTKEKIDVIQRHYGNAIRGNRNNLVGMREAVWAVYFHYNATDEEPTHNFCKVDWCPDKQAVAKGIVNDYKHASCLPKAVMNAMKPVFKDLASSSTQLLEKRLEGYTQNANECLNGLIWKYCPKVGNHGLRTVNIRVALAVSTFKGVQLLWGGCWKRWGCTWGYFPPTSL